MGEYRSLLAPYIQSFLQYREALFHKNTTYEPMLRSFDSFCADNFPGAALLSQEMVWTWMERTSMPRSGRVVNGSVIRKFAIYMNGIGGDAYILPEKMYGSNASFVPYIFTDDELQQLFMEIDAICPSAAQPYKHVVLPVMFRMIYTCGLRPTEARLLRTDNVYLESGEVLITGTKRNRDRIIVMSEDMRTLCADYNEQRRFFHLTVPFSFPVQMAWRLLQQPLHGSSADAGRKQIRIPRQHFEQEGVCLYRRHAGRCGAYGYLHLRRRQLEG